MVLYMAARAGTAQADELSAATALSSVAPDHDALVREQTDEDLESLPIELSQLARIDNDALAHADLEQPVTFSAENPSLQRHVADAPVDNALFEARPASASVAPAAGSRTAASDRSPRLADDTLVTASDGVLDITAPDRDSSASGSSSREERKSSSGGSIFPLDLDLAYADHMSGGERPDDAGGGVDDAMLASSAPAQGDDAIFATGNVETVSDAELSQQRGGFVYQGLDIHLGAEVRSYIGDELVLQTNFSWTDNTAEVQRVISAQLTPAVAAGIVSGDGINLNIGNDKVFFANQGQTAFIQRTDGSLQNIVINSASNIALRQQVDAQLDIANFGPFQMGALSDRINSSLGDMIGAALVGSIGR
jgi:hypothetical protein